MKQIPQLPCPIRLGMRGPKTPTWDKTSRKHFFKKSHLDLQLRAGSSFRKDTAPFSINIWKRHRPLQLFLHGHFELNHHNYPGGVTIMCRMINKQHFQVNSATINSKIIVYVFLLCVYKNCMFKILIKLCRPSGNFLFPHIGRNSTDQEKN